MSDRKSILTLNGSVCCSENMEQLTSNVQLLDGVDEARGSFSADRITVSFDSSAVSEDEITDVIGDAGVAVAETVTVDVSGV